jgi:hypothetical protein
VLGTIRFANKRRRTAEEEITSAGIADRPPAGTAAEIEERSALRGWNIRVDAEIIDITLVAGTGLVVGMGLGIDNPSRKLPTGGLRRAQMIRDRVRGSSAIFDAGGRLTAPAMRARGDDAETTNLSKHGIPADPASDVARNACRRRAL